MGIQLVDDVVGEFDEGGMVICFLTQGHTLAVFGKQSLEFFIRNNADMCTVWGKGVTQNIGQECVERDYFPAFDSLSETGLVTIRVMAARFSTIGIAL